MDETMVFKSIKMSISLESFKKSYIYLTYLF